MIFSATTLFFVIKLSLVLSVLNLIIRFCVFPTSPIVVKYQQKLLNFLLKKSSFFVVLGGCSKLTTKLFVGNPYWPRLLIISVSGLLVGVGLISRLYLSPETLSWQQNALLIGVALNGCFRGIINIGILVNNSSLWKQLLERATKRAGNRSISSDAPSAFTSEQPNQSAENVPQQGKQQEQQKEKHQNQYDKSCAIWGYVVGFSTIVGALAGIHNSYNIYKIRSQDPATPANMAKAEKEIEILKEEARRLEIERDFYNAMNEHLLELEAKRRGAVEDSVSSLEQNPHAANENHSNTPAQPPTIAQLYEEIKKNGL